MAHFSPIRRAVETVALLVSDISIDAHAGNMVEVKRGGGRGRTSVASNIIRTDGQVGDLEVLDAVHIEALIEDTVLDDTVALLRSHGARLSSS